MYACTMGCGRSARYVSGVQAANLLLTHSQAGHTPSDFIRQIHNEYERINGNNYDDDE